MKRLRPAHKIVAAFLALIFLGALILTLPICQKNGQWTPFLDALFDACNAVCVTGIQAHDIIDQYSVFGQIIILLLVQIGGLGFMTLTSILLVLIGRKITFKERLTIQESLNVDSLKGIVRFIKTITLMTLIIEAIGALCLTLLLIPEYGASAIWHGIFTSINAFCNAGYSLFKNGLSSQYDNPGVLAVIMILTLLGSIGFIVIIDLYHRFVKKTKITLHTRTIILFTSVLLIIGWICYFINEFNNDATIGNMSIFNKIFNSLFFAVSGRNSGYTTFDSTQLNGLSRMINDLLMFIGSSPGSTGGGIKITTVAILCYTLRSSLRGLNHVNVGRYTLEQKTIIKALTVFLMGILTVFTLITALTISETGNIGIIYYGESAFESIFHLSISVFSNAGQLPATGYSAVGKIIIMIGMFIGRVGLLTFSLMFFNPRGRDVVYPHGHILVG